MPTRMATATAAAMNARAKSFAEPQLVISRREFESGAENCRNITDWKFRPRLCKQAFSLVVPCWLYFGKDGQRLAKEDRVASIPSVSE